MHERDLHDLQALLTQLLRHFDADCKRAGVPYYLDGGTLLGAVRQAGWIPWDDDVDVILWRQDFERLRRHLNEHPTPGITLHDPMVDRRWSAIPRYSLAGSHRTAEDRDHLIGYTQTTELCIDVCVIDTGPDHQWQVRPWLLATLALQDLRLAKGIDLDRIRRLRPRRRRRVLTAVWLGCQLVPLRAIQRSYTAVATMFTGTSTTGYALNAGRRWRANPISRSWFNSRVRFCDHDYDAPQPHFYLRTMYGPDYLTPPPPDQRTGHNMSGVRAQFDGLRVESRP